MRVFTFTVIIDLNIIKDETMEFLLTDHNAALMLLKFCYFVRREG